MKFYNIKLDDVSWVQADNRIFVKGDDNSIAIRDQFVDEDSDWLTVLQPSSKDRIGGWENYHKWLRIAPDGFPYYQVATNCKNLIRTLPELQHDDIKVEDVDTAGEDHAPDEQSYMLKKVKWIDAGVGGVIHPTPATQYMPLAPQFIDEKQLSINLDRFGMVDQIEGSVGGVRKI